MSNASAMAIGEWTVEVISCGATGRLDHKRYNNRDLGALAAAT